MKQRRRIYYSAAQRSEIWDRWQAGEPMSSIGRRFDRESSSVFSDFANGWHPSSGSVPSQTVAQPRGDLSMAQHALFVTVDRAPPGTISVNHQP
jgi:hypothetical protein